MYQLYVSKPKSSWSLRAWILLKELNIPFDDKQVYYLDNLQEQRTKFAQFSPTSKIPVLHHQGSVIWDSLAIVEYIAEKPILKYGQRIKKHVLGLVVPVLKCIQDSLIYVMYVILVLWKKSPYPKFQRKLSKS